MPQIRVTYITHGDDSKCQEIRKYIEDAGIVLDIRDVEARPMERHELSKLIGHLDIKHFVNPSAKNFAKVGLDQPKSRDEILDILASDNTLLKRPIIRSARLMTIGCDKERIREMLQISASGVVEQPLPNGNSASRGYSSHRENRNSGGRSRATASAK